ncbi:GrpB family protein [Klebsiella pneumoniae]
MAYEQLKKELALQAQDRFGYTAGKTDFINEILKRVKLTKTKVH